MTSIFSMVLPGSESIFVQMFPINKKGHHCVIADTLTGSPEMIRDGSIGYLRINGPETGLGASKIVAVL
jgi:hypothetical protein